MIPKDCKRLAEVDFPIAVVSKHSARAMLMVLLLPDPCDPLCPGELKASAKELLLHMPG